MCCKAEASACAPDESILLSGEDKKWGRLAKFKLNKEELCCKAEASACTPEESILLSEDTWKGKKRKENMIKQRQMYS